MKAVAAAALAAAVAVGSASAGSATADLALLEIARDLAARLALPGPPPVAVRADREALDEARAARTRALGDPGALAARGRAWADLGLGAGDGPARLAAILGADLAGVAVAPGGRRLLVGESLLPDADFVVGGPDDADAQVLLATGVRPDEPLLAHALVHLARDGGAEAREDAATTDAVLARLALAEGEANLYAIRHLFRAMGLADDVVALGIDPGGVLDGRLVPPDLGRRAGAVDDLVQFVYRDGFEAVAARFGAGGADAVREFRARASTTRDVLHPQRAGAPTTSFGDVVLRGAGRVVDRDRLGEQGVVVLIARGTGKDNLALIAGDGWEGDEVVRWEVPDDPAAAVTVWSTAWATDEDAKDFAYAYRRVLETRFPGAVAGDGTDLRVEGDGRVFTVVRDGRTVRVTVGPAPPKPA